MKKLAFIIGVIGLIGSSAFGADLTRPVYKAPPPAPPPPPSWTGCYVDGGAGYGLWNIDHFSDPGLSGEPQTATTTSGGRGWLGTVGGGCDYQFSPATGWGNWVVGAFADYEFMDLHRNLLLSCGCGAGDEKESSAWGVGARIGLLVTPNVFTYWNGGYTESRFDGINFSNTATGAAVATSGAHTYHGWFLGGGTEISLSGFFGLPLPPGLFLRSEYRYSSFNSANLPITVVPGSGLTNGFENMKPFVQTITTALVYRFNWNGH
jgi:outer membrane immunogenic protein